MRTVKVRHGVIVDHDDGTFSHSETRITYELAEASVGHRLDRRRNYCFIEGKLCEVAEWTDTCSGCEGGGCYECGYTGKRRTAMWVPVSVDKEAPPCPTKP